MALRQTLTEALSPRRLVTGFDASLHGDFVAFDTLADRRRRDFVSGPDVLPWDADLVLGHFAHATTAAAWPEAQHITVLREPITRLLSHFLHWRSRPDEVLASWGDWGDRVRLARGTLVDFLSNERISCQTDNIIVRMLLWPDQAIAPTGFVPRADDDALFSAAKRILSGYSYVDTIEQPGFHRDLGNWLGQPVEDRKANVTDTMPVELRTTLAGLLTQQAISLLRERTRLDARLWRLTLGEAADPETLLLATLLPAVARYGVLMSGSDISAER